MKRLFVCLLLFAFVFSTAAVSTVCVRRSAGSLIDSLECTVKLINENKIQKATAQAKQTEKLWNKSSLTFFVFLDHETFSELDILMPMLSEFLSKDQKAAKEQLFRCEGILKDLTAHQRLSPGNIL